MLLNILQVPYTDPTMDRCAGAHEYLSSASVRSYSFGVAAGAVHVLCRVEKRPELQVSTRSLLNLQYQREANALLAQKIPIDTLSHLLWILSAGKGRGALDRSTTSLDVLSHAERQAFEHHVGVLQSLGLSYVVRAEGHHLEAQLEPPVDQLVVFSGLSNERHVIPPSVRKKEELGRESYPSL